VKRLALVWGAGMKRMALAWAWARGLVLSCIVALVLVSSATAALAWLVPTAFWVIFWSVSVPVTLALITVMLMLLNSEYLKAAIEMVRERPRDRRAGLALIRSTDNRVLFNRQTQQPWLGWWIFPGGYFNAKKGDSYPGDTAARRAKEIIGDQHVYRPGPCFAETRDTADYIMAVLSRGLQPVTDYLYLVLLDDQLLLREDQLALGSRDDLRWLSFDDCQREDIRIPPHMKDIADVVWRRVGGRRRPRFWTLHRDALDYLLQYLQASDGT
jgi:ADP-ribose pyrophosphatase YjhB (NUDIX family)